MRSLSQNTKRMSNFEIKKLSFLEWEKFRDKKRLNFEKKKNQNVKIESQIIR